MVCNSQHFNLGSNRDLVRVFDMNRKIPEAVIDEIMRLKDICNWGNEDIAKRFGMNPKTVANTYRLIKRGTHPYYKPKAKAEGGFRFFIMTPVADRATNY